MVNAFAVPGGYIYVTRGLLSIAEDEAEVAAVMDALGSDAAQVQPLFISIDPERDTPQQLAEFVPAFDANIIGLTGTADQIRRTSETFRVYFEKIEEAASPNGYTMGHSSQLFLFDPQGGYVGAWTYGTSAEEILSALLKNHKNIVYFYEKSVT